MEEWNPPGLALFRPLAHLASSQDSFKRFVCVKMGHTRRNNIRKTFFVVGHLIVELEALDLAVLYT